MSDQKLLDLVEGNARVINEIYESVMTLRKAVAIVQTLLEEQLEDPEEQLKKVGLRHAIRYPLPSWSVLESLLKALDQVEERPDAGAGGEDLEGDGIGDEPSRSADIEPETTADKGTLSAPAGRKEPDQRRREDMAKKLVLSRTGWTDAQYIIRRRDFIRDTAGCIRRLGIDSRCRVDSFRLAAVMFEFSFFYGYITELEKR
jgi:hypothetical protein